MAGALEGKVAIITGGGTGIGRACAIAFAQAGAQCVVVGRRLEKVEAVAAELADHGLPGLAMSCDVSRKEQVAEVVRRTVEHYGGVDILINNAHDLTDVFRSFMDSDEAHVLRSFNSGFFGAFHFLKACYPYLKDRSGKVVNMASYAGVRGLPNLFSYVVTKEAMRGMTRALAQEWGPDGINVNTICPHATDTETMERTKETTTQGMDEAQFYAQWPLRRAGRSAEVGSVALFLVSDASSYITGHTIMVDGGVGMDAGR